MKVFFPGDKEALNLMLMFPCPITAQSRRATSKRPRNLHQRPTLLPLFPLWGHT